MSFFIGPPPAGQTCACAGCSQPHSGPMHRDSRGVWRTSLCLLQTANRPHEFIVTEIRVYPTAHPEASRHVEVEPQTVKLRAIARWALQDEDLRRLGMIL